MRTPTSTIRLALAAVIAAFGLSILGIGAALAAPGKPTKPVAVSVSHERTSRDRSRDSDPSRDRASHEKSSTSHHERSDRMRDR